MNTKLLYLKKIPIEFFRNTFYYSPTFAFYSLIWWIGFLIRTPFSWKLTSFAIKRKTEWLDSYFNRKYSDILSKYKNLEDKEETVEKHNIWVFWGQGADAMPELVRACYNQLIRHNSNVVLVTSDNVNDIIDLPKGVFEKVKRGIIGWANYSDIIRNTILSKYGGLWLDATVWVAGEIPMSKLKKLPIFTAKNKEKIYSNSVCYWSSFDLNWSSWCLWANNKNNILFCFVRDMLQAIAEREHYWPDYVIQDYFYYFACQRFKQVREQMELISINSPNRGKLADILNEKYDKKKFDLLMSEGLVFKLRYRKPWKKFTPTGEQTVYSHIVKDNL